MSAQESQAFAEWLRSQLKTRRMSQRQLAFQSGVAHSTISRLLHKERTPSFDTAAKLARGLRVVGDEGDAPRYLGLMAGSGGHPTTRVEHAICADDMLGDPEARQVMDYYLALRARKLAVRGQGAGMPVRGAAADAN